MLNDVAVIFAEDSWLFIGSVFVLGLVVGSFLNVVIYRLPIILEREWQAQAADVLSAADASTIPGLQSETVRFSLSVPRSACPVCKAQISAAQNIPVVSWLILKGRCASCAVRISPRYPAVELATAVLSGWVAWHFGFTASAACALLITWVSIALTGIDIDHQLLPDSMTVPLTWAGLLAAVFIGPAVGQPLPVSPAAAVLGAAVGYLSLWSVYHAFRLVTGKEGMGYGDFKLFAAFGAWLGWKQLPVIIIMSAATGAVFGISMIMLRGRDRAAPMPFGPYLAGAGWLAMMYGGYANYSIHARIGAAALIMERFLRIGLTGGIASGKSTVARQFTELGVPVIDADESARRVVKTGTPGLSEIARKFGPGVIAADGNLDRRALRNLIFADPGLRRELEFILHPLIRADMDDRAAVAVGPYLVLAIPLLIEGGSRGRVDRILVVDTDEDTQLRRVVERDHESLERGQAILAAQADRATRLRSADDVLTNFGTVPELRQAVNALHERYLTLAAARKTQFN